MEKLKRLAAAFDLKRFVKFGLIGVLNTLVDFGVFWLMTRLIGDGPTVVLLGTAIVTGPYLANLVSYVVANIHSFLWNKFWTFERKDRITKREAVRYLVTSLGYVAISTACLGAFMKVLGLPAFAGLFPADWVPMLAKVPTAVVTIFYNYLMNKFWVFR